MTTFTLVISTREVQDQTSAGLGKMVPASLSLSTKSFSLMTAVTACMTA